MQKIKINETVAALTEIPVALVDDADGKTPVTGAILAPGELKICKAGGTEANHAGTLVEKAGGDYRYIPAASELNTLGVLTGRIVKTGVRTFRFSVLVVAYDPFTAPPTLEDIAQAVVNHPSITQLIANADAANTAASAAKTAAENLQTRVPAALSSDGNMLADVQSVKGQPLNDTKPFDVL